MRFQPELARFAGYVRRVVGGAALLGLISCAGCADDGVPRYRVSGTAHHGGQPIPVGRILFEPDTARGNTGPQGFAIIENGQFDTARAGSQGSIGGPMLIKIDGFDGVPQGEETPPLGTPLFPTTHVVPLDLPQADSTHDFDVPR